MLYPQNSKPFLKLTLFIGPLVSFDDGRIFLLMAFVFFRINHLNEICLNSTDKNQRMLIKTVSSRLSSGPFSSSPAETNKFLQEQQISLKSEKRRPLLAPAAANQQLVANV